MRGLNGEGQLREVRWYRTPKETAEDDDDDDDDDDWELKGWEPYGMVGEGGQRRRVKGRERLREEDGEIMRMGRRRSECGDVQDLIVKTAQRAAMTDADDGGPPWGAT